MMELLVFLVLLFGLFGVAERIERSTMKEASPEDIDLIRPLFRNRDALKPHP